MRGKPFQSKLEPHFDLIREARRKRQTWQAIVELLTAEGITTTRPAVYSFMKRRLKRRYPLGMASDELEDQLAALETSLSGFKVAENYHDVETEAQELKSQLQTLRNTAVALTANLRQIDDSLKTHPKPNTRHPSANHGGFGRASRQNDYGSGEKAVTGPALLGGAISSLSRI